jgi:hypothetical protein
LWISFSEQPIPIDQFASWNAAAEAWSFGSFPSLPPHVSRAAVRITTSLNL